MNSIGKEKKLEFFGNEAARKLFNDTTCLLQNMGGVKREIDFSPFLDAARLLYEGPWVAERYVAIEKMINEIFT